MLKLIDELHAVFAGLGPIRVRRMFGGYGIYHEDLMFALVADNVLYLKADTDSRAAFRERGLEPFVYFRCGRPVELSYYRAPEEIFEDPELAARWARDAWACARRAKPDSAD